MSSYGPLTKDTSSVLAGLAQVRIGNSAVNIKTASPVLTSSNSIGALANTKFNSNAEYLKLESGFPLMEDLSIPTREIANIECAFKEITITNMAIARGLDPTDCVIGSYAVTTAGDGTFDDSGNPVVPGDANIPETWTVTFTSATEYGVEGSVTGAPGGGATGATTADYEAKDTNGNIFFTLPAAGFSGTWASADVLVFVASLEYANDHSGTVALGGMTTPEFVRVETVYTYPNKQTLTVIFPRANVTSSVELEGQLEDFAAAPIVLEAKRSDSDMTGGDVAWDDMPLGALVFAA